MTVILNALSRTAHGAVRGFQTGFSTAIVGGLLLAGTRGAFGLVEIPLEAPSPFISSATIAAGTVVGAVAGLFGSENIERPARIASQITMLYCCCPFRNEEALEIIGALPDGQSIVTAQFQASLISGLGSRVFALGGGILNAGRAAFRRMI